MCKIPDTLAGTACCHHHNVPFKFCTTFILLLGKACTMKSYGNEKIFHVEVRSHPRYGIVTWLLSSFRQCVFIQQVAWRETWREHLAKLITYAVHLNVNCECVAVIEVANTALSRGTWSRSREVVLHLHKVFMTQLEYSFLGFEVWYSHSKIKTCWSQINTTEDRKTDRVICSFSKRVAWYLETLMCVLHTD